MPDSSTACRRCSRSTAVGSEQPDADGGGREQRDDAGASTRRRRPLAWPGRTARRRTRPPRCRGSRPTSRRRTRARCSSDRWRRSSTRRRRRSWSTAATPESSAYRGWRTAATRNPDGTRSRNAPNWAEREVERRPRPWPATSASGLTRALELAREDDVPEAAPRLGVAVDERRAERAGAERELEVQQRRDPEARRERGRDDAPPGQDRAVDGEHEQADGGDQEQRQAVVGERDPEHRRREDDPPVRTGAQARIIGFRGARRGRGPPSGAGARRSRPAARRGGHGHRRAFATCHTIGDRPNPTAAARTRWAAARRAGG